MGEVSTHRPRTMTYWNNRSENKGGASGGNWGLGDPMGQAQTFHSRHFWLISPPFHLTLLGGSEWFQDGDTHTQCQCLRTPSALIYEAVVTKANNDSKMARDPGICTIVLDNFRKWKRVSVLTFRVELPPRKQLGRFCPRKSGLWAVFLKEANHSGLHISSLHFTKKKEKREIHTRGIFPNFSRSCLLVSLPCSKDFCGGFLVEQIWLCSTCSLILSQA